MKEVIRSKAEEFGFDAIGFAEAKIGIHYQTQFDAFLQNRQHGDMDWLANTAFRRRDPKALWPATQTVIVLAANYGPDHDPISNISKRHRANISVYARNRDYHLIMKKRLKQLGRWLVKELECELKVFVDTAPILEKPLAQAAGIGWQGKHTNLVSQHFGSWLFLAEIFLNCPLEPDKGEMDHCGSCRKCLDICPTDAFPSPYKLDATRCISYLTIEYKGHIPKEFRVAIGNRIYGCDDCLAVCPWNKFARVANEISFIPREDLNLPLLKEFLNLGEEEFRRKFKGSPIKRIGRNRFLRNVLIAVANTRDPNFRSSLIQLLKDGSPLVRAMAVWALSLTISPTDFKDLASFHLAGEDDQNVLSEWYNVLVYD